MNDATDFRAIPRCCPGDAGVGRVDFIEAGSGPSVVLVHSSMSGARQWSGLMRDLGDRNRVRAINLFGYGGTPAWRYTRPPSLHDFADLVAAAVPDDAGPVMLVGHSLGGAVAMRAAAHQLKGRVRRLVLIEPSAFRLLERCGRQVAFAEICALADDTRQHIADGAPQIAAERFIDYWCGPGTWAGHPPERQASIVRLVALLMHEWQAVLADDMALADWAEALPRRTLVLWSTGTTRPARELVEILSEAGRLWAFARISEGNHMAPLTHPHIVNPLVRSFLA